MLAVGAVGGIGRLGLVAAAVRQLFDPRSLFAAGEQGVWFDQSDLSTLFQDSAGTTPVTAVEQPVGLMLDKSKGLVQGPELVTNGGFDNGLTAWVQVIGVHEVVAGRVRVIRPSNNQIGRLVSSVITCVVGRTYRITLNRFIGTAGGAEVVISNLPTSVASGVALQNLTAIDGFFAAYFTATQTSHWVFLQTPTTAAIGQFAEFDNISVRELPGNHAFQPTAIDRPILRNRYNLLTKTEQFADAAWGKSNYLSVLPVSHINPLGGGTAHLAIPSTDSSAKTIDRTDSIPAVNTKRIYAKAAGYRYLQLNYGAAYSFSYANFDLQTGTVTTQVGGNASITDAGNGWWLLSFVVTGTAIATAHGYTIVQNPTSIRGEAMTGDGTSGVYIWGASIVPADQAHLPYQRVNTATDYDSDQSKFPLYLAANGTNTWMQTNSIDFTGTDKVTVFAGVRKLSDSPIGLVTELSAAAGVSNPGSLWIAVPFATGASSNFAFNSVGTVQGTVSSAPIMAPITNVLTCIGNISGDQAILRVNGTQAAVSTADQGTGNYGNYPLYLFRRAGASLPFNGQFHGLLIRGALTSDPQTIAMERWLASKTGVTL